MKNYRAEIDFVKNLAIENIMRMFKVSSHDMRIYSGLTVISGVMLPNFCNTDSVYIQRCD